MQKIVIQTHNLHKQFGKFVAVDGINMPVYSGEVFGFLGPNGAGKTTTIGMILGLLHATSGRVELFGQPVSPAQTAPLTRVGALIGAPAFVPHFTATANLELVARLYDNIPKNRIGQVLELVGLASDNKRKARTFSTGMKQRLGLAAALIHQPDLLILDEPTSGLDPNGMREFRDTIRQLADDGTTVFLSSHLLNEVEQICDRVAVINNGKIAVQGQVAQLLSQDRAVQITLAEPYDAAEILRRIPDVTVTQNDDSLMVQGSSAEVIIEHLAANQIFPTKLSESGGNLEALFTNLTTEAPA